MKIALAQINPRVGDLAGNLDAILGAVESAAGADLVVLPELALTGYPPRDLLMDPGFLRETSQALFFLARELYGGPPALVGAPLPAPQERACSYCSRTRRSGRRRR